MAIYRTGRGRGGGGGQDGDGGGGPGGLIYDGDGIVDTFKTKWNNIYCRTAKNDRLQWRMQDLSRGGGGRHFCFPSSTILGSIFQTRRTGTHRITIHQPL